MSHGTQYFINWYLQMRHYSRSSAGKLVLLSLISCIQFPIIFFIMTSTIKRCQRNLLWSFYKVEILPIIYLPWSKIPILIKKNLKNIYCFSSNLSQFLVLSICVTSVFQSPCVMISLFPHIIWKEVLINKKRFEYFKVSTFLHSIDS